MRHLSPRRFSASQRGRQCLSFIGNPRFTRAHTARKVCLWPGGRHVPAGQAAFRQHRMRTVVIALGVIVLFTAGVLAGYGLMLLIRVMGW